MHASKSGLIRAPLLQSPAHTYQPSQQQQQQQQHMQQTNPNVNTSTNANMQQMQRPHIQQQQQQPTVAATSSANQNNHHHHHPPPPPASMYNSNHLPPPPPQQQQQQQHRQNNLVNTDKHGKVVSVTNQQKQNAKFVNQYLNKNRIALVADQLRSANGTSASDTLSNMHLQQQQQQTHQQQQQQYKLREPNLSSKIAQTLKRNSFDTDLPAQPTSSSSSSSAASVHVC